MSQKISPSNDHINASTPINNIEVSLVHLAQRLGTSFEASDHEVMVRVSGSRIEYFAINAGKPQSIDTQNLSSDKKLELLAKIGRKMLMHALEL